MYLIRTIILFCLGLWLKRQFKSELNFNSIKIVMMQVFLPAVIFYLILSNKDGISQVGLWTMFFATLFLNIITFVSAKHILPRLLPRLGQKVINTNAIMLSAYAPCITVVPIAAAISTNINATYAVLFDIGDKLFIFVALFGYISLKVKEKSLGLVHNLKFFASKILLQPINLALFLSLLLSSQNITLETFPPVFQQVLADIKAPLLILVPIFIAGVINFKNLSRTLLCILLYKYGFGFLVSAICLLLFPQLTAAGLGLLVITAPLACSSMWAKQNLMEFDQQKVSSQFDLNFADDLFTNSFAISLLLNFAIFSIGESAVNPPLILTIGVAFIILAVTLYRAGKPTQVEAKVDAQPLVEVGSQPVSTR